MIGGPAHVMSLVRLRLPKPRAGGYAALLAGVVIGIDPVLAARFGREYSE